VPASDIVLGLHPPYKRPYTNYGVAWVFYKPFRNWGDLLELLTVGSNSSMVS
jgi:alpha-amylase/alpha-mannosidase (GH57 family)